ncbi:MAG: IS4 family transposase [Bacteroidetes bacterium]|nr:IS4 family transposase [Bacteroidota bacterium]
MIVSAIFKKFKEKAPLPVMARALIERVFNAKMLDKWFEQTAEKQYTRELLFSSIFDIMSLVICKVQPTINSAYQSLEKEITVSIKSVYNKLNGIESIISAELVRYSATKSVALIKELGGGIENPLPGKQIKILDGNCLEASDHRIKELRGLRAGVLPGKSLVVLDPVLRLIIDAYPCEDGHAQERSLLKEVLPSIQRNDVWVGDRNFCIVSFLCGIASSDAFFIIRQHGNLPFELTDTKIKFIGDSPTGKVYEQLVEVVDSEEVKHTFRRITVKLTNETRDGDKEIHILTNLPSEEVTAIKVAELYKTRWKIETAFQELTRDFNSEINGLGYPKAALFGFCVALVTYNIYSVMKAAMQNVHGVEVVEEQISGYYIANEISNTKIGMEVAIPEKEWIQFRNMSNSQMAQFLIELAGMMKLRKYKKHSRGPKKKVIKEKFDKKVPHVSIAKILAKRNT